MFHRTSGNPFEEESLPKAYYFPSIERNLSSSQKKTCLSPNKDNEKQTSKADTKFLRESNKLEIPTREDGTVQHELSSGSQFNESWPSTDKNVSSLSQNNSSSSTTPGQRQKESHSEKITDDNLPDDTLSRPTLSKYIERFRRSAPTSREDRSLASCGDDFWWLSPPSNTSTPKETSDSSTSKYTSEDTSNVRRSATLTSSPRQKHGFKRDQYSRPLREAVLPRDSSTTDLLARTNELLEKSENTLSEISSESLPKPPSSWMIRKHKRLNDAAKQPVTKPRPVPEDDILYQWRLARRLERAQEEAKSGQGKHLENTASHRTSTSTRDRCNTYLPEQDQPRHRKDNQSGNDEFELHSGKMFFKHVSNIPDKTVHEDKIIQRERGVSLMPERGSFKCRKINRCAQDITGNNGTASLESNVPAVCFINEEKLPSHVHMMCDIVPCSKQVRSESRDADENQHYSMASNIGQKPRTEIDSDDIRCRDYFRQKSCTRVGDVAKGLSIPGATSASCDPELTDTEREKNDLGTADNKNQQTIPDKRQPLVVHSERVGLNSLGQTTNTLKTDPSTDTENSAISREGVENQFSENLTTTVEENEGKPLSDHTVRDNDLTNLDNASHPLASHHLHQGTDKDGSANQLNDLQNKGVIGTVIGQVISERLFSSVSSSRRSSLSSNNSVLTECEDVEDKKETKMVATSRECENHESQEAMTVTPDEILFPDDDMLIRLRRQADIYKEHLRNIDRILEHLSE